MSSVSLTQGVESESASLSNEPSVTEGSALFSSQGVLRKPPTFTVACWLLLLLAFMELMAVGVALVVKKGDAGVGEKDAEFEVAALIEKAREEAALAVYQEMETRPLQPRSVDQIIHDAGVAEGSGQMQEYSREIKAVKLSPHMASGLSNPAQLQSGNLFKKTTSLSTIKNPRVERLVQESRHFQLEGDVILSMLKLDEAQRIDPDECAVIYERGLLFEDMGSFTRAADQYQKIQQMGIVRAGSYFNLAASKLTKGMDTVTARRGSIAIGPIKLNRGAGQLSKKKVELAVTLLARPDQLPNPDDVMINVYFYDKVNGGDIKKAADNVNIEKYWEGEQVDWKEVGNEETFRVSYQIPLGDRAEEHLLGRREFYGYVVELLYKGEVVDQRAYPRRLHSIHGNHKLPSQYEFDMPWLPEDDGGILPDKNSGYEKDAALPVR